MKLSDFDYQIDTTRIAQKPLKNRDVSKLLILHKKTGRIEHRSFRNIVDYLEPGDLLILNNTRVIPSRLFGNKPTGGKAEITLLKEVATNRWEALIKGLNEGKIIIHDDITADITRLEGTLAMAEFKIAEGSGICPDRDIRSALHEIGAMPLPVYIKRTSEKEDLNRYQTVYSKEEGAIAAPTAGLHFTDQLLETIKKKGINIEPITLHVGYGTFKPVEADEIKDHRMDREHYVIPESTAIAINRAKQEGRRIIAVGTTATRTLESAALKDRPGEIRPGAGEASIFIYPGHTFRLVDALITNFHLPKSTPMMLASAFTGLDLLKKAYDESLTRDYRFFSYGDAMLII